MPHAGVGLSSIGDDDLADPSALGPLVLIAIDSRDREGWSVEDAVNWGGRTGEIMTKSSLCRGEGEGDSLCLPFDDGKGDWKEELFGNPNGLGDCGCDRTCVCDRIKADCGCGWDCKVPSVTVDDDDPEL